MRMHNPPHPGGVLLRQWIEPLIITQTATSRCFSQGAVRACHEHTGVSPEMAVRLSIALSAELWMNMQSSYDLWHAEQHRTELKVESLVATE